MSAQTLRTVHRFTGDEGREVYGVIQGTDGAFYGVNDMGDLVRINSEGVLSIRSGASNYNAYRSSLVQTSDGAFWATNGVCNQGCGQIVRFNANGTYEVMYSFQGGSDGNGVPAALTVSSSGDLYGVTTNGGSGSDPNGLGEGTIFKISQSGSYRQLHMFSAATEGGYPMNSLVQASDGNFYGVTSQGGPGGGGTIFRISPDGEFTLVYAFQGSGGSPSSNRLWEASPGHLIGSTANGGTVTGFCPFGCGTIFSISTGGQFQTIFRFTSDEHGKSPIDNLFQANDGRLYGRVDGLTSIRGVDCSVSANQANCWGAIFSVSSVGDLRNELLSTRPLPAGQPVGLLQSADGTFWRTTYTSGDPAFGPTLSGAEVEVFTPSSPLAQGPVQLSFNKTIVRPNTAATLHWQAVNAASLTMQQCFATIQSPGAGGGTWTGMQTGTSNGSVYSGSASIVPTVNGTYTYTLTCGGIETGFASLDVGIPPPLVIQTTSLPDGSLGAAYGPVALRATGGDGYYTWSVTSGGLPPGLTLDPSHGLISGVPTTAGSYPLTVKVTDGEDPVATASVSLILKVNIGSPSVSLLVSPASIQRGESSTFTATVASSQGVSITGGTVQFLVNGRTVGTPVAVVAGRAVLAGNVFNTPGTYAITAQYSGDVDYAAAASLPAQLIVSAPVPGIIITLTPSAIDAGGSTTIQAVLTGSPLPTGTVQFLSDGANVGSPIMLSDGAATLPNQIFTQAGTHAIGAAYSGDANFAPVSAANVNLVVRAVAATLSAQPPTIAIAAPGGSGTTDLLLTHFSSDAVRFTCKGLPIRATCSFSALRGSGSNGTASMQITTGSVGSLSADTTSRPTGPQLPIYAAALFGLLGITGACRRQRSVGSIFFAAFVMTLLCFASGCGVHLNQTPSGTYPITVSAVGGDASATTTVTLTVGNAAQPQ